MRMKKLLTILLTFAMVLSLLPANAFAANTATTMRLAKTQGTVTVTNSTDKAVTQTSNMKLYNGYKVKTGAKSYGWISLDDTKVAKLDANSGTEVQKSGQKLTLYLSSGNIFFNVKDPLKSGESFHIKTSTMTTGIRGTSGCVRVINDRVSEIHLLTGQVEVYVEDPLTGVTALATLKAGQKAKSMIADEAMAATGQQAGIIIESLDKDEVCGNCAEAIKADPELRERIKREAPHLLPDEIADHAGEKLAADEAAAEAKQDEIDEKVAAQEFPDEVDPYFEEKSGGGGGGGGSSSGGSGGSDNNNNTVVKEVDNWGDLADYIDRVNDGEKIDEIKLTQDISGKNEANTLPPIKSGESLTLNLGTSTLTLNDTLVNNGDLTITNEQGYITADITAYEDHGYMYPELIRNNGTLTQEDGILILPDGFGTCVAVVNEGTYNLKGGGIHNGEGNGDSAVKNQDGGVFNMSGGTIDFTGGGIAIENYAEMNMTGGTINVGVQSTGIYIGSGTEYDENGDPVTLLGTVTINGANAKIVGENGYLPEDDIMPYLATLVENAGRFELKNGTLSVGEYGDGVIASGDESITEVSGGTVEVAGADATGLSLQAGTSRFSGGKVKVTGSDAVGISVQADVVFSGTEVIVNSRSMQPATGVWLWGGAMNFSGGSVTAEATTINGEMYYGTAVKCESEDYLAEKLDENGDETGVKWPIKTTVRAKAEDEVFPVGSDAIAPAGYEVKDDTDNSGYFILIDPNNPSDPDIGGEGDGKEEDDTEITEPDVVYVTRYGDFVRALLEFNSGSKDMTIFFNEDDAITDEVITMVAEELGISIDMYDSIEIEDSPDDKTLIIDLNGYNLNIRSTSLNTLDTDGLNNKGSLIIKDSSDDETGTITGTTTELIRNSGTLVLLGGTITISADSTYWAVMNTGEMTMFGGAIHVTKGVGLRTGGTSAKFVMNDGSINVSGDSNGIEVYGMDVLKLQGGNIIATEDASNCIWTQDLGELKLTATAVKAKAPENLLHAKDEIEQQFKSAGPDSEGYYLLKKAPSQEEMDEALYIFAEKLMVYNMGGGNATISLRNDVPFDNEVLMQIKHFADILAELGFDEFVVWNGGDVLTIDLNGHDLILESTLLIGSYSRVKIIDSVGGGKIRGSAMQEMFILSDGASLTLDGVVMEVTEEGQVGIDYRSTGALTFTETTSMTVKGDDAFGILSQGTDLTVPEGCIILEGEGATDILQ